jgi:hypothetical protein
MNDVRTCQLILASDFAMTKDATSLSAKVCIWQCQLRGQKGLASHRRERAHEGQHERGFQDITEPGPLEQIQYGLEPWPWQIREWET